MSSLQLLTGPPTYKPVADITGFNSLIWTERFADVGEFQLQTPANDYFYNTLQLEMMLDLDSSANPMFIENITEVRPDNGTPYFQFTGRNLSRLLMDRVAPLVRNLPFVYNGSADAICATLFQDWCGTTGSNGFTTAYGYPGFSSDNSQITGTYPTLSYAIQPGSIFDRGKELADAYGFGWKCQAFGDDLQWTLIPVIDGTDRRVPQVFGTAIAYPPVIFSPMFDNMIDTKTIKSSASVKNAVYVHTSGTTSGRTSAWAPSSGAPTGFARRESILEASDIDDSAPSGAPVARGNVIVASTKKQTNLFDGKFLGEGNYRYRTDYEVGDTVYLQSERGVRFSARVSEHIISIDETGETSYPTLTIL